MSRRIALASLLFLRALGAQDAPPNTEVSVSRDSAAIASLEIRIERANVRRDVAFLDSVYAPDFRFKHTTGWLETRAERMASLRAPIADGDPRMISREVDSVDVEVHGNVALTTGRIHVRRIGGDPRLNMYVVRYARVYVRASAEKPWQLLTHHSTAETIGPP